MKFKILNIAAVLIFLFAIGCKKTIDNIKENLMMDLITDHTWKVVKYTEGSSNKTAILADYDFKFDDNGKVYAILDGVTQATGTWQGSEQTQSITSAFPTEGEPLNKLNGMWLISNTKSKPWRVFSYRTQDGIDFKLDLQEKE